MMIIINNPNDNLFLLTPGSKQNDLVFNLLPYEMLSLNDISGIEIVCLQGSLWITQTGEEADFTLRSNDRFFVTKPGSVLIQSLGESQVRLISPSRLWITSYVEMYGSNPLMKAHISSLPHLHNMLKRRQFTRDNRLPKI